MITIKKYPNRRLYDTSRSAYINLEELAQLVQAGHDVQIVDSKTGEDLTKEVLLQVVLEVLRGVDLLPVGMLRRIIRASGTTPAHLMLRQQLATGLDLVSAQLDRMEALLPPLTPPPAPAPAPTPDPERDEEADAELTALRERLKDLESRLKRKPG